MGRLYCLSRQASESELTVIERLPSLSVLAHIILQTLQASPNVNSIPKKLVVAKRLSQCLNPALPSGVHQRALEVYQHILTAIGVEGLRRDLAVWSPGLLPFFQFASTSVKPIILGIFERHYLPLGDDLRSITKALLLALLPGLEEESGEFFDRVFTFFAKLSDAVSPPFFYQNVWLVLMASQPVRLAALNLLSRKLPKVNGDDNGDKDVTQIVGKDLGLLVRGFCAALEDDNLLVRRAVLDLLITHLRIDSPTFKTLIRKEDRVRLVSASLGVVLRRDLSLNRRLYAWLLGPTEDIVAQQTYFEAHAQDLAYIALKDDLDRGPLVHVVPDKVEAIAGERQKPFKIFVPLLDKWTIGQPLTAILILDAFAALRRQLQGTESPSVGDVVDARVKGAATDLGTTAKMLFEVVDPFTMYRQIWRALSKELSIKPLQEEQGTSGKGSAVSLLRYVFKTFRVHDEESRQIHLPILFSVLVELLSKQLAASSDKPISGDTLANALQLASEILTLIPPSVFVRSSTEEAGEVEGDFRQHAAHFYESNTNAADEAARRYAGFHSPATLERLLCLSLQLPLQKGARVISTVLVDSFRLAAGLLRALDATVDSSVTSSMGIADPRSQPRIPFSPSGQWITSTLTILDEAKAFYEVEAATMALLERAKSRAIETSSQLQDRKAVKIIVSSLCVFMRADYVAYHVRCVELLWRLKSIIGGRYIESILCSRLCATEAEQRHEALDVFGVFWRHTDEDMLSSSTMAEPLLRVLDGLQSTDWADKVASERWLRTNLRSYSFYVDPLFATIMVEARRRPHTVPVAADLSLEMVRYAQPFDHDRVNYALGSLLALARFGSQAFVKSLRSSKKQGTTYMQALLDTLVLHLKSSDEEEGFAPRHAATHIVVADLVHTIVSRGSLGERQLEQLETVLLERILVGLHEGSSLLIQSRMLSTLHTVTNARASPSPVTPSNTLRKPPAPANAEAATELNPHPLLLRTIKAGLSTSGNRQALQYWSDFILATVPMYKKAVGSYLLPVNECVCALVRAAVDDLSRAYGRADRGSNASSQTTEADLSLLLGISEKVLVQSLESQAGDGILFEKGETTQNLAARRSLHHTVRTLHALWVVSSRRQMPHEDARSMSMSYAFPKIKSRSRRCLEKLYRNHSGELVESLIDCWIESSGGEDLGESAFEILDTLAPSAQIVVTFLCDVISTRTSSSSTALSSTNGEGKRKAGSEAIVSDIALFDFLDAYLSRLDGSTAVQVWPVVIMLVKDFVANSTGHKAQMLPTLRLFTTIGDKLSQTTSLEDRRTKREVHDNYIRLCDFNILMAGRSFDQQSSTKWIGGGNAQASDSDSIDQTDLPPHLEAIVHFLAKSALPALRRFGVETDRILSVCSNAVYYLVAPTIRGSGKVASPRPLDINATVLAVLGEICKLPGTLKSWRSIVSDTFFDQRFFQQNIHSGAKNWQPVVFALFNQDKERFLELVSRITAVSTGPQINIFTSRESEILARALTLRRLTYVILSSRVQDHFLPQLPSIQEKIVDVVRASEARDLVAGEVYLTMRVLLVRFSPQHLASFWPVLITEMVSVCVLACILTLLTSASLTRRSSLNLRSRPSHKIRRTICSCFSRLASSSIFSWSCKRMTSKSTTGSL